MDPVQALIELGGVAGLARLAERVPRRELASAVEDGRVLLTARGNYALPETDSAVARAHSLGGTLCLASAALYHDWPVKTVPRLPQVSIPRNRRLVRAQLSLAEIHRHDLGVDDVVDGSATSKETTLLQCLRSLPEDEALAIADSASRAGEDVMVHRVARLARGAGAAKVRRIAGRASGDAANPFESVARAIALTVPGLRVEPQRLITSVTPWVRPDLVDLDLRIVIEADSFAWHGDRQSLSRDAQRYNRLVVDGWIVLRFTWDDVMFAPDEVRAVMVRAVECAELRTEVAGRTIRPA